MSERASDQRETERWRDGVVGTTEEEYDRIRQQNEIDAETAASASTMPRALEDARDRHLDRREAGLDERKQRLDEREAGLDEREAGQGRRDDVLRDREHQVDQRDQQADQREINAETAWPDD